MRPRPLAWIFLSVLCFTAAFYFWRLGDRWTTRRAAAPAPLTQPVTRHPSPAAPFVLLSQPGNLNSPPPTDTPSNNAPRTTNQFALRLSNTTTPIGQLQRNDHAILLENALLDTTRPVPSIPDHLRAKGDPGSYLVQARGPLDNAFRALLQAAGATIVSYIPNNAYLVRASAAAARQLQAAPQTQTVLPYEPYYKLKLSLLTLAVPQAPLPDNTVLSVLLFADAREATRAALQDLGASILGDEEPSPFGPVLQVVPPTGGLPALAGLPGVQEVEWALTRAPANDYSRVRIGVATDIYVPTNYLGLSGTNVMVNINDSGVDATHPDLAPRVFGDSTNTLVDPNGHGTHVAGIISSSGSNSFTVGTNASGPNGPYLSTNSQLRGKAPGSTLFALPVGMFTGPLADGGTRSWPSDSYLQETAARTNAFISNNSWNYVGNGANTYDIHAASYDAAVRDALPRVTGSRPLLYVFSAGNAGGGHSDGTVGNPDTILSPGTAKNVITVGAIEQIRNITNQVYKCSTVNSTNSCKTNQPWLSMTDANNQVASFSSRGPVGVGIEGDSGRFKPDLVAPGTFVISTRSAQWDTNAYYNPTSHIVSVYQNIVVPTNTTFRDTVFVPDNALQLSVSVASNTNSPVPFPDLLMYVKQTGYPTNTDPVVGTNHFTTPPDGFPNLSPVGVYWYFAISNRSGGQVICDLITNIMVTNDLGNYLPVLAGMNDSLGGLYRYESGTSMAAADVSGTLALMQEFFEQRLGRTNSPALMKALLINGARSVGNLYDFQAAADVVSQGWGLVNLPTTLPIALNTNLALTTNVMVMVDQSPTNALATGQSRTYKVALSSAARTQNLRVTLVWTDPPGNPLASVKLVNDLDLVVTNLDRTNLVYFGNDITAGNDFNKSWNTNLAANIDSVNNVENVFLTPTLGVGSKLSTNYSITVTGHRVNVNAVTAQTNNVCQDYALVISCGDGVTTNALAFDTNSVIVSSNQPLVTVITNSFINSPGYSGGILFNQRVGANAQLLGTNTLILTNDANGVDTLGVTNQWHFYFITNDLNFTNAAFLTFLPANLAVPRMGVFEPTAALATRPQADIDLYVAPPPPLIPNNLALTNLDPAVVAAASKSLSRGGTETIVYSNAVPGGVYCIGVQSEDQQAAEYALLGVFSLLPFGTSDSNGVHLVGIPTFQPIPDGSPHMPGVATIIGINVSSMKVRRVIVTNVVSHELMGDLLGNLNNGTFSSVLNNHTCVVDTDTTPPSCQIWTSYIFDDSSEHNVGPDNSLTHPHVTHTDGPGDLSVFGGRDGLGQWMLSMVDNATNHVGTNIGMAIFLERQADLTGGGITVDIQGNSCRDDFIDIPPNAESMTIEVAVRRATGPVNLTLEVCPLGGGLCKSTSISNSVGGSVTIDQTDIPPLQIGATYRVRTCNLDFAPIRVNIRASFTFSATTFRPVLSTNTIAPVEILDDAITDVFLTNDLHHIISSLDIGLLITDPRISDLAITLISPNGTRVLLFENRGAGSTNGLGTFNLTTNYVMAPFYTNNFDLAPVGLYATGTVFQTWNVVSNFVDVLDDYTCLCLSNHILALFDGAVTNMLPTTNSLPVTNANPYVLSYKVTHLPWLEGMVTWWPLDVDGSDIFGGFDGLLLGDAAFSTGQTNAFFDNFSTNTLNPLWQKSLPNAGTGAGPIPVENYFNTPNYSFNLIGTNTVIELLNTLTETQRVGWISSSNFHGQNFRYEARFNTLTQGANLGPVGFIELWILDAANSNRFDVVSLFGGAPGNTNLLLAGSSIEGSYNSLPFNYQNDTWYRLVISALPNQGVRAAVLSDAGFELAGVSFIHGASAFRSGFKIGLSQFVGESTLSATADVDIDWVALTSGLAGEVNQAYYGDGVATRIIVPRCPVLDLGRGNGFSIEGWINPFNVTNPSPLVEWYDPAPPTNQPSLGVQLWLALTNGPGSLGAIIWDTNQQPYVITTVTNAFANAITNAITNGGWQHVALTYDTNSGRAALYINGLTTNNMPLVVTNLGHFVPRTSGDVYLGYDPRIVPTPIYYTNFNSTVGLNLIGDAVQNGNVLRLTRAVTGQLGNAWATNKQPCAAGFDTRFRFQITNLVSGGADGIWFTVQNVGPTYSACFANQCNATNSVSVFFNTAYNWPGCTNYTNCDLSGNSVGIVTNGVYVAQRDLDLLPNPINLKGGTNHDAHITFDGAGLTVWLDGVLLLANVPVPTMASAVDDVGRAWVGLGAITGADSEDQNILSWTFGGPVPGTFFVGGLDEFSLYNRALTPCEVNAIFNAGPRGKYGTNVLVCPVVTEVALFNTAAGNQIFTFTNGVTWTNDGPHWETNIIAFSNTIAFSTSTNLTPIIVRGRNPYDPADTNAQNNLNAVVDDFVLSELVPQTVDGLLHFTEDTNLAVLPIKFAPTPFTDTNFPPVLIFSNDFSYATAGVYQAGATILGSTNSPSLGLRNWTVTNGPVTVISNAFLDAMATNCLALATGAVQCVLPTAPGHRYQLSYSVRGPCAVGWWNGSVEPLSQRAQDIISGNNGAFFNGATNTTTAFFGDTSQAFVGRAGLFFGSYPDAYYDPDIFPDKDIDDPASKIELADPPQLRFTNAFTLEGWINPFPPPSSPGTGREFICPDQQIFFRGYPEPFDCGGQGDPYWLALEPSTNLTQWDLHFHIAQASRGAFSADVLTTNGPIVAGGGTNNGWWHIAAVFDKPFTNIVVVNGTNSFTISTNALRLYVNGVCVATNYTTLSPYQDLDPALSPGVAIGGRCGYDWTQPYQGYMDEITAYARALTEPEIVAIASAGILGKADSAVPVGQSLAKLNVTLDGAQLSTGYGDNSQWTAHTVTFTALQTNAVLTLQSLLPGTLLHGVTLTELPPELFYLPEVPLSDIFGEDGYGIWTLEIWDNRAGPGPATNGAQLIEWQLNLGFAPSNPPPVINLAHGIPYTNSIPAHAVQYFVVQVPQWAIWATNVLEFAHQVRAANPEPVTVFFSQTNFPGPTNLALIGPGLFPPPHILGTNTVPPLLTGQSYYLALTNPNPVGVTFALGVWFDITTLTNCEMLVTNIVAQPGIPRYFQFDVPTNGTIGPQSVSFWLSNAPCALKVVLSEHLPLPDLNHFDYTSQQPCTNDQIIMLVTNSTPFPIQTNRWYVGVFNTGPTNASFSVQACSAPLYPEIILLTNGIPFVVSSNTSPYAARPGPPQLFYYDFIITNWVPGVLFELYNLSGNADLVLQHNVPPTMPPYFDTSFFTGTNAEQIVVRTDPTLPADASVPDLRSHWYLGVYNHDPSNLTYTIRAVLPDDHTHLLQSGQPLNKTQTLLTLPRGLLLAWNSVVGERYLVQYIPNIATPSILTNIASVTATTPLTTFEVNPYQTRGIYQVVQVFNYQPTLYIDRWSTNQVRLSWSRAYPGFTLQSQPVLFGVWSTNFPPANVSSNRYENFDNINQTQTYYRLIK